MPKRKLAAIHKWMGLWLAVYLGLQALAGIVLTFETDILRALTTGGASPAAADGSPAVRDQDVALGEVLSLLARDYPDRYAERINYPVAAGLPFLARLPEADGNRTWVQVDPASGTTAPLSLPFEAMEIISDFHINLVAGSAGHYLVGVTGLVLIASLVTGFILGWPGLKRLQKSFRLSFRVPVTGWFQLHRSTGLVSVLIILATTFTGSVLVFGPWLKPLVTDASPPLVMTEGEPLPATELLRRAQREFPGSKVRSVRLEPDEAVYRVVFSGDREGRARPSNQVWIDPATGRIQTLADGDDLAPADAFFAWMYPLHVEFGLGRFGQLVSVIGALALLMLSASGLEIWLKRRQMRVSRRTELRPQRQSGQA